MDKDLLVLEQITNAIHSFDRKYRLADINGKFELRGERDKLYNAYTNARYNLLEDGIISSDQDIQEMMDIRAEIEQAIQTQTIVVGVAKLVKFLAKYAV